MRGSFSFGVLSLSFLIGHLSWVKWEEGINGVLAWSVNSIW